MPTRHRALLLLATLAACSDYNFTEDKEPEPGDEDSGVIDDPGDTDTDTPPPDDEECNGVDDNGNGEIDEGYPDTDLDGIADCVDEDCEVDQPAPGTVTVDEDCLAPDIEVVDPWNVAIEWQYTVTGGSGVIVMPAVGNLTDDNGDGVIDGDDDPDIVFTTWNQNTLVALHGDGSGVIWERSGYDGNAGVAIADVDNDGAPEVIAANTSRQIVAVSADGTPEWTSQSFSWQYYPQPTVADLEGDGDVEVVFDIAVVEGSSGATVTTLGGVTSSWRAPVIADVDDDGQQEILLAEHAYSPTGSIEFSVSRVGDSTFAAVADIDGDPGGESFWVTGNQMHIVDDDGSLLRTVAINPSSSRPGPPAVADFDGDGQVEVAVPGSTQLELWEIDGTKKWGNSIQDNSGIAGVSGYDVDADGIYEVLYADEVSLRVFDGATGTVLYTNTNHSSGTLWEYPVVADVDGDDSAEIVIASNGTVWKGVTVLGHAGDGWAKSGPTWSLHDFAMTNLDEDGAVPSPAPKSWDVYNVFRARPTVDDAAVDLSVEIVDVCFSGCTDESPAQVAVQVGNPGGLEAEAGARIALYRLDGTTETLLALEVVPDAIPSGETSATIVFPITKGDFGSDGILVRVDDDGTGAGIQDECDEENNEDVYADWPC
jgi:hypothetical protein